MTARSISIIICTRGRPDSLRLTLNLLAAADRTGIEVQVLVVDNSGGDPRTQAVTESYRDSLGAVYLTEPRSGKSYALNRALDFGPKGGVIAVLDDDMSPESEWFQGVFAISDRWPNHGFFTGRSHIIWPDCEIPAWAKQGQIWPWAFSVMSCGDQDRECKGDRWFSGNHYWFRSNVLLDGRRYEEHPGFHLSEQRFMLKLTEDGFRGVQGKDAVVGHRIQVSLLDLGSIRTRAARVGSGFARARIEPFRKTVRHAIFCQGHPFLARCLCFGACLLWLPVALGPIFPKAPPRLIVFQIKAAERSRFYWELLKALHTMPEYSIFRRFIRNPADHESGSRARADGPHPSAPTGDRKTRPR